MMDVQLMDVQLTSVQQMGRASPLAPLPNAPATIVPLPLHRTHSIFRTVEICCVHVCTESSSSLSTCLGARLASIVVSMGGRGSTVSPRWAHAAILVRARVVCRQSIRSRISSSPSPRGTLAGCASSGTYTQRSRRSRCSRGSPPMSDTAMSAAGSSSRTRPLRLPPPRFKMHTLRVPLENPFLGSSRDSDSVSPFSTKARVVGLSRKSTRTSLCIVRDKWRDGRGEQRRCTQGQPRSSTGQVRRCQPRRRSLHTHVASASASALVSLSVVLLSADRARARRERK